jgi:hypothetical protein
MNHRGVEYTVTEVETDLWHWRFQIGQTVTTGRTVTRLRGMASREAQLRIDMELRMPRTLAAEN